MSPLSRRAAAAAWLGDALLAVILPADAVTEVTLIDLYWIFLWIRTVATALLFRLDFRQQVTWSARTGRVVATAFGGLGARCA